MLGLLIPFRADGHEVPVYLDDFIGIRALYVHRFRNIQYLSLIE